MSLQEVPAPIDTACLGEVLAEWIFDLEWDDLAPNRTIVVKGVSRDLGGAAVNVYWYLRQLGRRSRFIAPVGRADVSKIRAMLDPDGSGSLHTIPIDEDSDTLFSIVGKETHRSIYSLCDWPVSIETRLFNSCITADPLILNGGRHPELRKCYLRLAKNSSAALVAFNPSYAIFEYSRSELTTLFERANITVVNRDEFTHLESVLGYCLPTQDLADREHITLVTDGPAGVEIIGATESLHLPSFTSRDGVVIGAGDAFFAGFIHRFLDCTDVHQSTRFALALAAMVVDANEIRTVVSEGDVLRRLAANHSGHPSNVR